MFEIEIKARLDEGEVDLLAKSLDAASGSTATPVFQIDSIFVPHPLALRDIDARAAPVIRVRVEDGAHVTLTLKRDRADELDSVEFEVGVTSAEAIQKILEELGFHSVVSVRKFRRKWHTPGFSVCLDEVARLGTFIECERSTDEPIDVEACRRQMWQWLEQWGVTAGDAVHQGYDRLMDSLLNSQTTVSRGRSSDGAS